MIYIYRGVANRLHREYPHVEITAETVAAVIDKYRAGQTEDLVPWEIAAVAGVREYGIEVEVE